MIRASLRGRTFVSLAGVALVVLASLAQANPPSQPYYEQLWEWLETNNYKHWSDTQKPAGDFREGESPHGDLIKVYANRAALSAEDELPEGSVLVLENYAEDKSLISVNVMQQAADFDRKNGDWYYATYLPNGTVAKALSSRNGEIAFAGRVASCIECHSDAWDDDHVFFND